ncbi:MAG: helix-turn-helix transcriptional regulator [Pseudomonadota bacterium]
MGTPDINSHVGLRLRLRRTTLGLTQEAVARGIGVAAQQVQKYEKGTNVMNVNRLHEFAQFLHVPVGYFFDGLGKTDAVHAYVEQEDPFEDGGKAVSDRESIEIVKSFRRIKDHALRKRLADLLRTLSLREL